MAPSFSFLPRLLALLVVLTSSLQVHSQEPTCNITDVVHSIIREPGRCIWYSTCANSSEGATGGKYNCFDNDKARKVSSFDQKFKDLLEETCPEYFHGGLVCCDYSQILTLATQLKIPRQLFSRCPACLKNLIQHFCFTTCDPDQALHVTPTKCEAGKTTDGTKKPAITDLDFYITKEYANDLYGSCSNVQYPQASNRVVDIMCGGTDSCNSTLWLQYLGDPKQNQQSPFHMGYIFGDNTSLIPEGATYKDYNYTKCYTNDSKYQCSCADCNSTVLCPPSPQAPKSTFPRTAVEWSIVGVGVVVSTVIFVAALLLGILSVMRGKCGEHGGYSPIGEDGATEHESLTASSGGSINSEDGDVMGSTAAGPPGKGICISCYTIGAHLENWIKRVFYHWGCFVAQFWYLVIIVGLFLIFLILILTFVLHVTKIAPFNITTDPVKLWSAPDSRARQEKDYFDANFNPFFRTEMFIVTAKNPDDYFVFQPSGVIGVTNWTFGPVFTNHVLSEVYDIQNDLINMVVPGKLDNGSHVNVTLNDICFKPLAPDNNNCTIMSVLNYFQNDRTKLDYVERFLINNSYHIYYCARDPTAIGDPTFQRMDMPCLGAFGGPVDPNVALGGFNTLPNGSPNYNNATALIVSFTVNNHLDDEDNQMAKIWEKAFLDYLGNYTTEHINITYSAERSIEDELARESRADIFTILFSYVLMFVYITLSLGHIRGFCTLLIDLKVTVGLVGVLMVLLAVVTSICFLNLTRVTVTLIILEVVPFLVLAVGVDNLFIIVHSYERQVRKFANVGDISDVPVKEFIGRAIAEVAPSLLLTSFSETAAFLLGGVSTMPAVRTFSFYAGVAVFFNFLLQISVFLAALSLDARRQMHNHFDVLYCLSQKGFFNPRRGLDLMKYIMNGFANIILFPIVRPFILLLFGITTTMSLFLALRLEIGLDQTLALPKDSYLNGYFSDLYEYLHTGSPVYFVIKEGFNYSDPIDQAKFCSAAGCDRESIGTEIFGYSRNSELTGIAEPAMLWLDTYFEWIAPHSECCFFSNETDEFCHYENETCRPCVTNLTQNGWPYPSDFNKYLQYFLIDNPGKHCPSGGHAAFGAGVKLKDDNETVRTSYVMTYHSIMTNSSSFISGLKWARRLADKLTDFTGVEIFPYSVFYVFYEQYLTTIHDFCLNIGISIGAVFLVSFLLLGLNLVAAAIVMLIVSMIIIHMLGCMALTNINANAVSLVNLVMTVGISVEFCSHIVRWFVSCNLESRVARARSALANMGASVVSGITLTKLIGVFVLFFAKSQIFEVYYFRMYMFMLLWGALHGLIFLPVLLSYVGPVYVPIKLNLPYRDPTHTNSNSQSVRDRNGSASPSQQYPTAPPNEQSRLVQ